MGRVASVGIETVDAAPMAATAHRTRFAGLADTIGAGLAAADAVLRAGDYGPQGCNAVYYAPMTDTEVMDILTGVRLEQAFPGPVGEVVAAETPGGEVAHAVYFGPYNQMRPAHDAARACAHDAGREITGASWEVYGDWTENPDNLRTDIFWLLKANPHG